MGNAYEEDQARLEPVFDLKWVVLDPPQRISTILGSVGGGFGAASGIFVSAEYNPLFFIVFLPFASTASLFVESSLHSDVRRKERSNGICDATHFVGADLFSDTLASTTSVSVP
jgi:hypothetical protein